MCMCCPGLPAAAPRAAKQYFDYFDTDKSGSVSEEEFVQLHQNLVENGMLTAAQSDSFADMDKTGEGGVDFNEYGAASLCAAPPFQPPDPAPSPDTIARPTKVDNVDVSPTRLHSLSTPVLRACAHHAAPHTMAVDWLASKGVFK